MSSIIFNRVMSDIDECISDIEYIHSKLDYIRSDTCFGISPLIYVNEVFKSDPSCLRFIVEFNKEWDQFLHYSKIFANGIYKLFMSFEIINRRSSELEYKEKKIIREKILLYEETMNNLHNELNFQPVKFLNDETKRIQFSFQVEESLTRF